MKKVLLVICFGAVSLIGADGAKLYKPCIICHGKKGEKKALGKGKIIRGWSVKKTIDSLKGYKSGTYGGAMKGIMKPHVARLSNADMQALGEYIEGLSQNKK